MISAGDISAAASRIRGEVRHTPVIAADQLKSSLGTDIRVTLKLELLQVTGSFKARGATNKLMKTPPHVLEKGIVAASGGNHGLATARAGFVSAVPTWIYLPSNATPEKIAKLHQWGAQTRIVGSSWHEANAAALAHVEHTNAAYFHPFADPDVVAGQGTVALEILEQVGQVDTILVAMGGGGLISGVSTAAKAINPDIRIVGVEAAGCPVLLRSLEAGKNQALEHITTSVATMACAHTDERIFETVRANVDEIVLVDDKEMQRAAEWLWFEMGLAADLSGAAAIAALMQERISTRSGEHVCAIVCGAGREGIVDR